jgi:hypothetical protein
MMPFFVLWAQSQPTSKLGTELKKAIVKPSATPKVVGSNRPYPIFDRWVKDEDSFTIREQELLARQAIGEAIIAQIDFHFLMHSFVRRAN